MYFSTHNKVIHITYRQNIILSKTFANKESYLKYKNNIFMFIFNSIQHRYRLQNQSFTVCDEKCNFNGFSRCFSRTIFLDISWTVFLYCFPRQFLQDVFPGPLLATFLADLKKYSSVQYFKIFGSRHIS